MNRVCANKDIKAFRKPRYTRLGSNYSSGENVIMIVLLFKDEKRKCILIRFEINI